MLKKIENLCNLSDEELVKRFQNGNNDAVNVIMTRYENLVQIMTKDLFILGADRDDLIQEGKIGIYNAMKSYSDDRNASFKTFVSTCINGQINTAIRKASRKKHIPLNGYVSFDDPNYNIQTDIELWDKISETTSINPEAVFINKEIDTDLENKINKILTEFEYKVWCYYLENMSYQEIAALVNRDVKSVDNALQRIKKKLKDKLDV